MHGEYTVTFMLDVFYTLHLIWEGDCDVTSHRFEDKYRRFGGPAPSILNAEE